MTTPPEDLAPFAATPRGRPEPSRLAWRRLLAGLGAGAATLARSACAGQPRSPVPEALVSRATVPGYSDIRYWGDDAGSINTATIDLLASQIRASGRSNGSILAISGGGSNGAFGAGLLFGWSEAGTRQEFAVVTGVSTGSLTAPFAFLGSPCDEQLRESYTNVSGDDIYARRSVFGLIKTGAAADNTPLRRLVGDYVSDQMVADIAREYAKGRRLLIGTTNIDAERPVVWDIAASDVPTRAELIQDILVASASIPGVFPATRIQVVADGIAYDEIHVDGGTSNQAFTLPSNFSVTAGSDARSSARSTSSATAR